MQAESCCDAALDYTSRLRYSGGMSWTSPLAERCKDFEALTTKPTGPRDQPLLVRLDGRAFHTYTRGLARPFDARLSACMLAAARALVEDLHPHVAYTQSDEITLLFYADPAHESACLPFDGRYQKLASVCAGLASSAFALSAVLLLPERAGQTPHFDGRAWSVPDADAALDAFLWRVGDATKNSISMAAQSVYSHRQLLNKSSEVKLSMLREKGIDWTQYPDFFRVGSFLRRVAQPVTLTEEDRAKIPSKHRPPANALVSRTKVVEVVPSNPLTWAWLIGKV